MSEGWPENFLRGSTIYKRVIWTKDDEETEEGWACVVCGEFVPDGALNTQYDTHEILHISQAKGGLIMPPRYSSGVCAWNIIDEKNLPARVTWKK